MLCARLVTATLIADKDVMVTPSHSSMFYATDAMPARVSPTAEPDLAQVGTGHKPHVINMVGLVVPSPELGNSEDDDFVEVLSSPFNEHQ